MKRTNHDIPRISSLTMSAGDRATIVADVGTMGWVLPGSSSVASATASFLISPSGSSTSARAVWFVPFFFFPLRLRNGFFRVGATIAASLSDSPVSSMEAVPSTGTPPSAAGPLLTSGGSERLGSRSGTTVSASSVRSTDIGSTS